MWNPPAHWGGLLSLCALVAGWAAVGSAYGQAVCLPSPRLLTTWPMGGQAGTEVEVEITGENLEEIAELLFSHPGITAKPLPPASPDAETTRFHVSIARDTPAGVHEARVLSRLGVSSSRAFSVGTMPESVCNRDRGTRQTAWELPLNSLCNAVLNPKAVDHFSFSGKQGERVVIDCAARGIDSKMYPVLILADAQGRDLVAERRGGALDVTLPADGKYFIKVQELTYQGGPTHFYRLAIRSAAPGEIIPRLPTTRTVSAFSWPPLGLPATAATTEVEPNQGSTAQRISLPCDVAGAFFPAADVDSYEFEGRQGETWWIEVASERLGRPTDPALVVQRIIEKDGQSTYEDVLELNDIPPPMKPSTNHYSYDGPPYNGGSPDVMGKLVLPADGRYRLQVRDLFGATRRDPLNVYRLVIRRAAPDFALAAWALHMELRNGDRNALSKPLALRGGTTVALEVVAVRRDGFDGDIELSLESLPAGVRASGLKIPAGASRGIMLISAAEDAPRGYAMARFQGRSRIGQEEVVRPVWLASMVWPVRDQWSEIPTPRLLADVPVSVGGSEHTPLTIQPREERVFAAPAGGKLTIPLRLVRRSEFSGPAMQLRTFGVGLEQNPRFEIPLTGDGAEAVLDLAALKTPPGDYLIAFYGSAVAKYQYNPGAVLLAENQHRRAAETEATLAAQAKKLMADSATAAPEKRPDMEKAAQAAQEKHKQASAAMQSAAKRLQAAKDQAQPKDIVDIIVSQPISLRVLPTESK